MVLQRHTIEGVGDDYYKNPKHAARYERDLTRSAIDDVPFYVSLARQAALHAQPVLELGCGTGRVTIPMAQAGANVTGLDSASAMLDIASMKAERAGVAIRWVEGDMADFQLDETFGLVVIPFRSFLHLTTEEEQERCLGCIKRHLMPGGTLALDFYVPGGGSSAGSRASKVYRSMRLRDVSRPEMEGLLRRAGFDLRALHGGFDGRVFDEESTEMVWIARKPSTVAIY